MRRRHEFEPDRSKGILKKTTEDASRQKKIPDQMQSWIIEAHN